MNIEIDSREIMAYLRDKYGLDVKPIIEKMDVGPMLYVKQEIEKHPNTMRTIHLENDNGYYPNFTLFLKCEKS